MAYVDDFLLAATNTDIQNQRDYFLDTLQNLGWHVSWEKSSLDPSQAKRSTEYSCSSRDKNPTRQIRHLKRDIRRALNNATVSAKSLARIAGQCISMSLAVIPENHIQTSGKKKVLGRQNSRGHSVRFWAPVGFAC